MHIQPNSRASRGAGRVDLARHGVDGRDARCGEFRRAGHQPRATFRDGARGVDLEGQPPTEAQWKSHNYNHLMEQPTIFYAIALTLALMDFGGGINYWLAWGYVGFGSSTASIQATVNVVALPLHDVRSRLAVPDRADDPRRPADPPRLRDHRLKQAASSTWVDQRNWPTGRTQSSA